MQCLYAGTAGRLPKKSGPLLLLGAAPISSALYPPGPGLPAEPQNQSCFWMGVLALSASSLSAALQWILHPGYQLRAPYSGCRILGYLPPLSAMSFIAAASTKPLS